MIADHGGELSDRLTGKDKFVLGGAFVSGAAFGVGGRILGMPVELFPPVIDLISTVGLERYAAKKLMIYASYGAGVFAAHADQIYFMIGQFYK